MDSGILALTDKHLYFGGTAKSFRIKYDKIISFTPFSDGVQVMKDTATARPQVFQTRDGWFTCNLLSSLSAL